MGGKESGIANQLTAAADGAIYLGGYTYSNLNGQKNSGSGDAFISRYNPDGSVAWTTLLGGTGYDHPDALMTGSDGAIYAAGYTLSPSFDGQKVSGLSDAFLTRYNPDGTKAWSKIFGGLGDEIGAVFTGDDGYVYFSGVAAVYSSDGQTIVGRKDSFISRYNPNGTQAWIEPVTDTGITNARYAVKDGAGAFYAAGDIKGGLGSQASNGGTDAFIIKFHLEITNHPATGSITISGPSNQGQTLTVISNLEDLDGLGTISYQWSVNGLAIAGATSSTFVLTQAEVGKTITVTASYTDGYGSAETVASSGKVVVNTNDLPSGCVTITGNATQGQTLTSTNTLLDRDGLGVIGYQWKAGGTAIAGATNSTLLPSQAEVGKAITVVASYTDGFGQVESVSSIATDLIRVGTSPLTGHAYDWKTHTLLSDVDVKLISQNSGTSLESKSGAGSKCGFVLLDAGSYQLDFSKALTTAETGSAINSADVLAALKIAAADANQDGKITSADALDILKLAVKRTDAPAREWLFVNENQDFWNETTSSFTTTRSSVVWDKALQVSSQLTTQQNVVAVLKGDVNGSWTAPTGSQDLDITTPSYFNDLATKIGTQVN